ncbi:RNA polymerase sigma factor SigJ [Conyzicola nivalis]|uniref:RNA polymerase sigma24 factor n=1 Tax=Conyzicola nivalis TaxID=1477021 RepID=A0A916SI28_9MICO|nr:RNA polymerase sigma factor SigJ [Conyzicola nivalis]GGB00458.1 RNA polymerase sigma24 factor [Conyzicola nivalis]
MTVAPPGSADHRRLFGVAYRILGSVHDAEDAVQEGLVRWHRLDQDQRDLVREPMAWLTRVVSRICLDELGSARARREQYTGIWLPEPLIGTYAGKGSGREAMDPADSISLDESVSLALLVAMERLSPGERVSLILHDVFGLSFDDVAEIVGRTTGSCRQLASIARRKIGAPPRSASTPSDQKGREGVLTAFLGACMSGDLETLVRVLDPSVVSRADGGDHIRAARKAVVGSDLVARYLLGVVGKQRQLTATLATTIELVNGRTGIVTRDQDRIIGVFDLEIVNGRVTEIAIQVNPDKLHVYAP